jgi:hypothetical protein
MNFTAGYLAYFKKSIKDELGHPISTIKITPEKCPLKYCPPYIEYDILDNNDRKMKEPILHNIIDLKEIERMGYVVCSIELDKNSKWRPRQNCMYALFLKGSLQESQYKKLSILPRGNKSYHKIVFDSANMIMKLVGQSAGPTGEGPWVEVRNA